MAVLKSPKNVRNKKIWTRIYSVKSRNRHTHNVLTAARRIFPVADICSEQALSFRLQGRRWSPVWSILGYRNKASLYWVLRRRDEWSPDLHLTWRHYRDLFVYVTRDFKTYKFDFYYRQLLIRLERYMPTKTHQFFGWLGSTPQFKTTASWLTFILEWLALTIKTIRKPFLRFFGTPKSNNIPKKYVRWGFKKEVRSFVWKKTILQSAGLTSQNPINTPLLNKLRRHRKNQL